MSTEITDADWVAEPQDMDYAHWSPEFQALQRMVQSSLETFHSSLTASIGELKATVRDNMILAGPASRQPLSRSATGNSVRDKSAQMNLAKLTLSMSLDCTPRLEQSNHRRG